MRAEESRRPRWIAVADIRQRRVHRRRQLRPLFSGQSRWASRLGSVVEHGHFALDDYLQSVVASLGKNTKQFFDFIGREARIVEERNSQLFGCFRVSFPLQLLA